MSMFRSSPFEDLVVKATHEQNVTDDWATIIDICDKTVNYEEGPKYCLQAIKKRLSHKVPRVVMQTLILLDACVKNCGKKFHLEISSRYFIAEIEKLLSKMQPPTANKLKQLLKKWAENEFKDDPELGLIPSLYYKLKSEGMEFPDEPEQPKQAPKPISMDPNVVSSQEEEEDIIKAIALSLEETGKSDACLKDDVTNSSSLSGSATIELMKVRALYDFEAVEDNELTIKAGEIVLILDKSNSSWWKGSNHRGEGYIPANFVTEDLDAPVLDVNGAEEETLPKVIDDDSTNEVVLIDEAKIQRALDWLNDIDPSCETEDPEDLLILERQSYSMAPLIEEKLQQIDKKCTMLNAVNEELMEAVQLFYTLNSLGSSTLSHSSDAHAQCLSTQENQLHTFPHGHHNYIPQHYMLKQVERSVSTPLSNSQGHFVSVSTHPSQTNVPTVPLSQSFSSYCYQPVLTMLQTPEIDSSYQMMLTSVPEQQVTRHPHSTTPNRNELQPVTTSCSSNATNEVVDTHCNPSALHPGVPVVYQPVMFPPQFTSQNSAHHGVALASYPSNLLIQPPPTFVHPHSVNTFIPHHIAQVVVPASSNTLNSLNVSHPSHDVNSEHRAAVSDVCILDTTQELPTSIQSCLPATAVNNENHISVNNGVAESSATLPETSEKTNV